MRISHTSPDGRILLAVDLPAEALPVDPVVLKIRDDIIQCVAGLHSELKLVDAVCEQRRELTRDYD